MIIKFDELKKIRKENNFKKIVFVSGVFDWLHISHLKFLESAKKEGEILVVGLGNDKSVKLLKGETRPIFNETERAEMVDGLKCVDYCFINKEIGGLDSYLDMEKEAIEVLNNVLTNLKPDKWIYRGDKFSERLLEHIAQANNVDFKILEKPEGKIYGYHSSDLFLENQIKLIKRINRKAAVIMILSEESGEIILNEYTKDYRIKGYIGGFNFIGGGIERADYSPYHAALRELKEEIDDEKISNIISSYIKRYKDFFIYVPEIFEEEVFALIYSYIAVIPQEKFEVVKKYIRGRDNFPEGKIAVLNISDILDGQIKVVGTLPKILGLFLNKNIKDISNQEVVEI